LPQDMKSKLEELGDGSENGHKETQLRGWVKKQFAFSENEKSGYSEAVGL